MTVPPNTVICLDGDHATTFAFCQSLIQQKAVLFIMTRNLSHWHGFSGVHLLAKPLRLSRFYDAYQKISGQTALDSNTPINTKIIVPRRCQKVLIVEDNTTNRHVVATMLDRLGFDTELADNGLSCLEKLEHASAIKHPYDLVLMDCQMPIMDGYTATTLWRKREEQGLINGHMPIVALTANVFEADRQRCLTVGMDDFLAKPLVLENLMTVINRLLPTDEVPPLEHKPPEPISVNELQQFDASPLQRLQIATGDPNIIRDIATLFRDDAKNQLIDLQNLHQQQDYPNLARAAHKFKGACLTVGLRHCAEICEALDHQSRHHDSKNIDDSMRRLLASFPRALAALEHAANLTIPHGADHD
jgi:CheY-like chemotaxis protein/HPt (histidine-containing phosphotransfer) domain-containing protein